MTTEKKSNFIKSIAAGFVLAAMAPIASATLLVEQWQSPTGQYNGLAGADAVIASGPADVTTTFDIIDFTDDPGGFAGLIPGSNPWPAAQASGVGGTGHSLNDFFVARISGIVEIAEADTYWFRTFADDGVRLRIGGTDVIVDDSYHAEEQRLGSIFLDIGLYELDLVFFEGGGEASLEFSVRQGNTGSFVHIPDLPSISASVPAPGVMALFGLGLMLLGLRRRH